MTQDDKNKPDSEPVESDTSDQGVSLKEETRTDEELAPPQDSELANIIEAALYAAKEPVGIRKLTSLFPDDAQPTRVDIQNVILSLQEQCEHRGIELRRIGNGWRYQTKEKYAPWLRKLSGQKAPRYSRALLETLSIIAYRQPVTRGDIEEIRGVGVSSDTIRTLEERGWVSQIGHRDVPGRPALFGTSQGFLEYFNMTGLSELPELMEKRELGAIAKEMNLTFPMDGVRDEASAPDLLSEDGEPVTAEVIELRPDANSQEAELDNSELGSEEMADDESNADGATDESAEETESESHDINGIEEGNDAPDSEPQS